MYQQFPLAASTIANVRHLHQYNRQPELVGYVPKATHLRGYKSGQLEIIAILGSKMHS